MRVWVDITDAAHVLFLAPVVRRLEEGGHTVTVTARRFAGADLVLRRYGLPAVLTTTHRGGGVGTRAVGLANRTAQLLGSAASGRFDVAVGTHASDFVLTAWTLGIPQMTLLDDERLRRSNAVNVRLVDEVAVPDAVPAAALTALGAPPAKQFRYPGFKEEYYLYDVSPDPGALTRLGVDRRDVAGVVRPAPTGEPTRARPNTAAARAAAATRADAAAAEAALAAIVRELAGRRRLTLVVLARDPAQRRRFLGLASAGLVVADGPVDGIGLIAAADFVLGAGGAMTREAAALGTPAYTVAVRRPAAVDAALLADGRLRRATSAADLLLKKKDAFVSPLRPRDPQLFVDRLLALAHRSYRRARLGRFVRDLGDGQSPPLV